MTREEQVQVCRRCMHHSFDVQKGIICGKTEDIADFSDRCEQFIPSLKPEEKIEVGPSEIKGFLHYTIHKIV